MAGSQQSALSCSDERRVGSDATDQQELVKPLVRKPNLLQIGQLPPREWIDCMHGGTNRSEQAKRLAAINDALGLLLTKSIQCRQRLRAVTPANAGTRWSECNANAMQCRDGVGRI